ncbi:MAG: ABC transporter ATP-binding protein, partial [Saprospiraceae bacterium]|nr:ABC transporter ATP-binding protein [Saprospiraceae bacterium]
MKTRLKRLRKKARIVNNRRAWKYYLRYFRWRSYILVISFFLTIAQAAVFLPVATTLRNILNKYIQAGDTAQIYKSGVIVLGLLLLHAAIRLTNKRIILHHNKRIHNLIRDDLFKKMYDVPKMFYTRLEGIKWHTIYTHDVMRLDQMSASLFTGFLPAIVICLALSAVMIYISPVLFLIVLAIAPIIFVTMLIITSRLKRVVFVRRKAIQKYSKRINFALNMMDLTRIQVAEDTEIERQVGHNAYLRTLEIRTAWLNEVFRTIQETLIMIATIILLVGGGLAAIKGSLSFGDLFTFYVVFMFCRRYIFQLFGFIPSIVNGDEALDRVWDIVSVDQDRPYQGNLAPTGGGSITLRDVYFSYGQEPLLDGINLEIREGEFVALQGDNGSGKTTLLYLILGFYRPHAGDILFGGISYEDLDIKAMRRQFGVVLQESPIFRGTIYENIMYGRVDVPEAQFQQACEISGVNEFVPVLKKGLQTQVGDSGLLLSGGQRQRIAIARALVTKPK